MENIKHLLEDEFDSFIKHEKKPILVDFFAKWCSPCKMQTPILEELATTLSDKVVICKVDVDESESLAIKLGISSIPCLMVFKGGELKEQSVGLTGKADISAMLIKYL